MSGEGCGVAVSVQAAYMRYSPSSVVLRGLDLTVPEACIYGLLGPSGCGKTTLLRSIVGLMRLDAGNIHVKAQYRNKVGYMPQELCLFEYMSIAESFQFYGRLYGMKNEDAIDRGHELAEFLELPSIDRLIGSLSGGQQRRLSFAVTLIHNPDLLILDEPTVGIDPILSAAIWVRLVEMATCQRKTIIITTHYIEEARQAHVIGLMREGVLLAQQTPQSLMSSQGCDSLEGAFLSLSQKQQLTKQSSTATPVDNYPSNTKKSEPALTDCCPYWKCDRFSAQFTKNITWLWRNFSAAMLFLIFPAAISWVCHVVLSGDPGKYRTLGIVSPELVDGMETCTSLNYTGCDDYARPFSCRFIDYLTNSSIHTVLYEDLVAGQEATRRNHVWGVLVFSSNYTESALERTQGTLLDTTDYVLETSSINAYMDMSNMWVSTFMRREIIQDVQRMIEGFLTDCQYNPKLLDIPIQFNPPIFGVESPTFLQTFIPGVVCSFAFYLAIAYTSGAIMFEKKSGLERSLVAGMTKLEVVVAHCLVQVAISVIQETLVVIVFYYMFDNPCKGSLYMLWTIIISMQVMGLFLGLVLGLFFKDERDASNAAVGVVNFLFMTCGLLWPVEGMHPYLRSVAWAIPVQPAVESYRSVAMRGWGLSNPVVYKGFLSTATWIAIFIVTTIALCRTSKNSL